ncbi:MAG: hypothetical protein JWL84_1368 [Rhodospirillales bacterium]|jgi:uncharacterized protein (DUF1330 family)|nr:hypothetical protein [Rhodospirillales bacterium]
MTAYFIVDMTITDPEAMEAYWHLAAASVARHDGKFIVRGGLRGGRIETVEGGWSPGRIVVIEFPNLAAAHAFYESPDYAPLLKMRLAATESKAVFVEA